MPQRPNIIYLHSHDTGRWISPHGYPVDTPNIARLAAEGMLFGNNHSASPTCSPSRAALLTGESPHQNGVMGLVHRGFALYHPERHLANTLRKAGYHTALAGMQHVAHGDGAIQACGYQHVLADYEDAHIAAERFLRAKPSGPFFLDIGFFETHRTYPAGGSDGCPFLPDHLPATDAVRTDMAGFHRSVKKLDDKIGKVMQALDDSGLAEQTLVICTTDHGPAFPNMKCNLGVRGTGVYMILRGPGGFTGGKRTDTLTSHLDLYPTVCELTNCEQPDWLQGHSLTPLTADPQTPIREWTSSEVTYHAAYDPKRAIRTADWAYCRRYGDRPQPVLPNCDDSPSKDAMLAEGWADSCLPMEELYDLQADPEESHNVADDTRHAEILHDMRRKLDEWMRDSQDPLLEGPVAPPPGTQLNRVDGLSALEDTYAYGG